MVSLRIAALLAFGMLGCAGNPAVREAGVPDSPVPAAEPRGVLRAVVDLPSTQGCEEKFDLVLYRDRAVDLIEWDGARGACSRRTVVIRYLSSRTSADRLTAAARQLAIRFEPESQGK